MGNSSSAPTYSTPASDAAALLALARADPSLHALLNSSADSAAILSLYNNVSAAKSHAETARGAIRSTAATRGDYELFQQFPMLATDPYVSDAALSAAFRAAHLRTQLAAGAACIAKSCSDADARTLQELVPHMTRGDLVTLAETCSDAKYQALEPLLHENERITISAVRAEAAAKVAAKVFEAAASMGVSSTSSAIVAAADAVIAVTEGVQVAAVDAAATAADLAADVQAAAEEVRADAADVQAVAEEVKALAQ